MSDDAKSILEWLENPFTNKKTTLTIAIHTVKKVPGKDIFINESLYKEMLQYCNKNKSINVELGKDQFTARFDD